ncbi:hypothetical protein BGX28_006056 [Mortierella sp. GBA30]|nr:hypothetical protein BGX28_006056 [Mortierella sp. GBA30]
MAVSPSPSPSNPPPIPSNAPLRSSVTLVFAQGGSTCLLRPNAVVRGHVALNLTKACYAAGIRIRLRAEETALVLGQESNGEALRQKYQQSVVTLFDTETMVSGSNQNDNELSNWEEILPGSYTYPFALKVPNGVEGFSIRYVWTAHVDGPFEASLCSEEVLCQFMPNVLAPKPMEWTFHDTVGAVMSKGSQHQLNKPLSGIALSIKMLQQIYVPGDPLSMTTTVVNNSTNKVAGIDVMLRRTIKGSVATSYANLSNQNEVEMMTESVECKVRPGETGQVDILTTIPPMSKFYSVPTFESNFLKVYYELQCIVRVKRSVFAGGDTTYQCAIPVPIATHNIDNPMISGRTPRWTKSRLQPYFFEPSWSDPVGDLPASLADSGTKVCVTGSTESSNLGNNTSASVAPLTSSPATSTSAMQEFLNSGSAELHRERTLKKSLTRSKSLKDIQSARLTGSSWRAERDQLINQSREQLGSSQLNRPTTDASQSNQGQSHCQGQGQSSVSRRSPPLNPKNRSSNEEKYEGALPAGATGAFDSNGNVGYTPPPPPALRPQKAAQREYSSEQQAELARKASRRILPNQGSYTNEGTLPPDMPSTENQYQSPASNAQGNNSNNTVSYPIPSNVTTSSSAAAGNNFINKPPPRRNASLSHMHQTSQNGVSNGAYTPDQETMDSAPRGGNKNNASYGANTQYESSSHGSRNRSNNSSSDQGYVRQGQYSDTGKPTPEQYTQQPNDRVPYQHSLPASQQPPGVVSPVTSPSLLGLSHLTGNSSGMNTSTDQSSSRREAAVTNNAIPAHNKDEGGYHQRHASSGSNSNNNNISGSGTCANHANNGLSGNFMRIPPWERVERVHQQNWFKPGPHQSGALQTFDVASVQPSTVQTVPIMKKTLQRPIDAV